MEYVSLFSSPGICLNHKPLCRTQVSVTVTQPLIAGGQLLHGPAVSVRIAEEDERAPVEFLDVAHLDPAPEELRTGAVDVRDHDLEAPDRPGTCTSSSRHSTEGGSLP